MPKKGKLTELLTQEPPDFKKLMLYSRSKKKLDSYDLGKLATFYHDVKKKYSQITPLHVACWSCNKPELVRTLVNEGWSINTDGEFGSPICITLGAGNISVADLLIELGADTKKFYCDGVTPMYYALGVKKREKTCVAAVKLLLDSGVSVNAVVNHNNKERAIHIAVDNKLPSVVSFLLQKGAKANIQDRNGNRPIHIAVENNDLDMVKLLLLHDVDLMVENQAKDTPLLMAVKLDYTGIVEELIKGGCDSDTPCSNGMTSPFHTAVYFHKVEIVKMMIDLGANPNKALPSGVTPLHVIGTPNFRNTEERENFQKRKDIAEYLVDNGATLNITNNSIYTPLKHALKAGFLSLAKLFIKLGADMNIRDKDGDTIFHQVVPLNRDITITILEFGGDYHAYNDDIVTPYHLAISRMVDLKYIKSFVKHGCPYDQDLPRWTKIVKRNKQADCFFASEKIFFKGIKENNLELVKSSVRDGAVPSSCSEEMKHPLHFIALHGYNELLTFLLEENVQPNSLNEEGKTPLHLAVSKGHYDTCCILLRYGACYNYRSKKCPKSPRMIASDLKHNAIVELLDSVNDLFSKSRSKKRQVLSDFESKLKSDFENPLFRKVTDIKGNTVLTTALLHKRYVNAKEMMKMWLQYSLSSKL